MPTYRIIEGDCLDVLRRQSDDAYDFTFTSPPYEDARDYGIGYELRGDDWVFWCLDRFVKCLRVTNGLVAFVVDGRTRKGRYSFTPEKLAIELQRRGYVVPKPGIFERYGVPGKSNWLRPINETIVCASKVWPLPYTNYKSGPPPKYKRGGDFSNRTKDGKRVSRRQYPKVEKTWQTNVFRGPVGKGHMGHELAHENEAPFPQWLAEQWLEVFCPPQGKVLDPFAGSGTTLAAANKLGMHATGIDIRDTQTQLMEQRLS